MLASDRNNQPLVTLRNIRKEYPGVVALDDVSLSLYPGEVHALMGENGSGKSTLIKILSGVIPPTKGTIEIDGREVFLNSPRKALELGIVSITQELTLAPTLSVAENVLLGRLPKKGIRVDWKAAYELAEQALNQLGVKVDLRKPVRELSTELQQEIEIARAISIRSRVIILDEATSSLSMHATHRLLEKVEQLRAQGVAIVIVSHRLPEIYACAQKATVLRDGKFIDVVSIQNTPESDMVRKMVGRAISDLYPAKLKPVGLAMFEASNISTPDNKVHQVNLQVKSGEILGIAGLVGCGKSELGLALFGAIPSNYSAIKLNGKSLTIKNTVDAIEAGIAYVPEDRKTSAIFMTRSVSENLSVSWMDVLSKGIMLDVKKERSLSEAIRRRFRIKTASLQARITSLSGGNQQKVILGRWFEKKPKVVILNEPTRGVDIGAKKEIYGYIQEMADEGAAVILISSELPEILGLSDRVLIMYQGRVQKELAKHEMSEEAIAHYAFGGRGLQEHG